MGCRYLTAEVSDSGEVIREMPRTGTGPFPARRSGFPVPASQYGFMARDTQFSSAPYSGSYGSAGTSQYGLAVPGSYYGPVAVPARDDAAQDYATREVAAQAHTAQDGLTQDGLTQDSTARDSTARDSAARDDTAQDGLARDDPDRPPQWPLQTRLDLGALPGAVPCARLHARLVLTEWGQAQAGDSVELIVSELMTNALRACTDPVGGRPGYDVEGRQLPLGLRLASDRRQVLVEIWDGNMSPPVPGQTSLDGETGRGLLMVEAVSSRWGYYYPAHQSHGTAPDERAAKVVWALIVPGA
jgi:hypothetical protein